MHCKYALIMRFKICELLYAKLFKHSVYLIKYSWGFRLLGYAVNTQIIFALIMHNELCILSLNCNCILIYAYYFMRFV